MTIEERKQIYGDRERQVFICYNVVTRCINIWGMFSFEQGWHENWKLVTKQIPESVADAFCDAIDERYGEINDFCYLLDEWNSWKFTGALLANPIKEAYYRPPVAESRRKMPKPNSPIQPKSRRNISLKVRFLILKRDGYKCCICGATAKGGAILEIDHKVPVAKGGGNEDSNLWTLCYDCNHGKSDRDL